MFIKFEQVSLVIMKSEVMLLKSFWYGDLCKGNFMFIKFELPIYTDKKNHEI